MANEHNFKEEKDILKELQSEYAKKLWRHLSLDYLHTKVTIIKNKSIILTKKFYESVLFAPALVHIVFS